MIVAGGGWIISKRRYRPQRIVYVREVRPRSRRSTPKVSHGGGVIDSLSHAGVLFLVYLFLAVAVFFVVSSPTDAILSALDDADLGAASDEMNLYVPYYKSAIQIVFALGLAFPMTWFIFWVFSREPDWGYRP